ncbi:hypothetical protein PsYK624_061660 [Phanerochaete sordida]|uniref:Uncharacterized protein n=1 Tax=Phanerochaete sordida TaxID=48140 RepID=A0A9P3G912_9APHY|nr:hypothetical protein PsYK624_061660 [Phanerochaete sordida]
MSTRQNKKRKGRGNVINRERTVTTLTEGSEGSFMAADDPHASLMPHPFSVASSVSDTTTISPGFPMTPSFTTYPPYAYMSSTPVTPGSMYSQPQAPAHFFPTQPPPPGQNDLEILERLKETIKAGQHEFFQPVPRPTALASIYLGPHHASQVPPHPEQVPDYRSDSRRLSPGSQAANGHGESGVRKQDSTSSSLALGDSMDSTSRNLDMDPPGLNTPLVSAHSEIGSSGPRSQGLSRSATEKALDSQYSMKSSGELAAKSNNFDSKDYRGSRDPAWSSRNGSGLSGDARRYEEDRNGRSGVDSRYGAADTRPPQRYVDRERDRDRERERDRDLERDRDRRGTDFSARYAREDRRDERYRYGDTRRPPPDDHYDSRTRPSVPRDTDDRPGPPSDPHPPRSLPDERSSEPRLHRPGGEDRPGDTRIPPTSGDDRSLHARADERDARDRQSRPPGDDRRPLPPASERGLKPTSPDNRRSGLPMDRSTKLSDDRRPPLSTANDKQMDPRSPEGIRPSANGETPARPPVSSDSRRGPPPSPSTRAPPTAGVTDDRVVRPAERSAGLHPPPERPRPLPADDRRGAPPAPSRATDDRRPPDDYPAKPPAPLSAAPPRPLDDRARAEDKPARQPSLQDRLSRPGDSLLPARSVADDRAITSSSDTASARPALDSATIPARPSDVRPPSDARPLPDRLSRPEDRGRPLTSDRFARTSPTRDRSPPRYNYAKNRPLSLVREDASPRSFKPRGETVSPRRTEFVRPPDRASYPDRYERDRSRDRRSDIMEVDPPRFSDRAQPAGYRRSPPPFNPDRPWSETYAGDVVRRDLPPPPPPPGYRREWREDDRLTPNVPFDEWDRERRDWDRPPTMDRDRDHDRDRFLSREPPPPSWETREERDRRVSGGFPPAPLSIAGDAPPSRPFDSRPLSARLSEPYAADDRDRFERARYPPLDASPGSYSRVRGRSPTPPRRPGAPIDDLRPPMKRARDDAYGPSGYYPPPPGALDAGREYSPPPRRTPQPGGYYDDARDYPPRGPSPAPSVRDRDRDFLERDSYPPYDRREPPPLGRMAPPRSPPPYARGPYGRDDRRYPPPRP